LNKERKEKLKQEQSKELSQEQSKEPTSHAAFYGGGTFLIFVAGGIALYFYFQQKNPDSKKNDKDSKNDDIFRMN